MENTQTVSVTFNSADDAVFVPLIQGLSICADSRCFNYAEKSFEETERDAATEGLGSIMLVAELLRAHALELEGDLQGALTVLESTGNTAEEAEYWKCLAMVHAWRGRLHTQDKQLELASASFKKASDTFRKVGDFQKVGFYECWAGKPKNSLMP
jgi:hypothetical protein